LEKRKTSLAAAVPTLALVLACSLATARLEAAIYSPPSSNRVEPDTRTPGPMSAGRARQTKPAPQPKEDPQPASVAQIEKGHKSDCAPPMRSE
jgi:hypothetical protein